MIETVKTIGSLVGLATGIFILYDRLARGRPVASLTISRENERPSPRIRISNPSSYDVAILNVTCHPRVYLLTDQEGPEGNLRASFGHIPDFMLKPGESKEVRIVPRFEDGVPLELR